MHTEMTVDDAINVARVVGDLRSDDADGEVRELAVAARRLARQVDEQSLELERERARRLVMLVHESAFEMDLEAPVGISHQRLDRIGRLPFVDS